MQTWALSLGFIIYMLLLLLRNTGGDSANRHILCAVDQQLWERGTFSSVPSLGEHAVSRNMYNKNTIEMVHCMPYRSSQQISTFLSVLHATVLHTLNFKGPANSPPQTWRMG
jgi:hypothetical protein